MSEEKTNGLPNKIAAKWPTVSTEPVKSEVIFYHNWLYSVVPARKGTIGYDFETYKEEPGLNIYLAGFCRNCGKGFTAPFDFGESYIETIMNVKKEGCVAP